MQWLPVILILPYLIFLLVIYKSLRRIKLFENAGAPTLFVSVVAACRNEEQFLPQLLDSLSAQNYSADLAEIIIVDDNSTDSTYEIANKYAGKFKIHSLRNRGKGKKEALSTGIDAARGDLIITIDADCHMQNNWMKTIAAFYEKNKPDMIICPVKLEQKRGLFGRFQELEFLSLQGITAGTAFAGNGIMCNGANLAFNREVYLNHKKNLHFEIESGDDVFFLHSLKKTTGSEILWLESKDATVTTAASPTVSSFFTQRRRWISKSNAITDTYSIILGIVTFVTIFTQISIITASIINKKFLIVLLVYYILKMIPDFLILNNTAKRYERKSLMNWFIPAQIIYPFYVVGILLYSSLSPVKRKTSYPSQKGT